MQSIPPEMFSVLCCTRPVLLCFSEITEVELHRNPPVIHPGLVSPGMRQEAAFLGFLGFISGISGISGVSGIYFWDFWGFGVSWISEVFGIYFWDFWDLWGLFLGFLGSAFALGGCCVPRGTEG